MLIRHALPTDAEDLVELFQTLDGETSFMLYEAGERQTNVTEQQKRLEHFQDSSTRAMLLAVANDNPVGFVAGIGGHVRRNKHSLYIVIGVRQAFAGQGIGKALMSRLEDWAAEQRFHRLELTVMARNEVAIKLYESCGFAREGIKIDALLVGCEYLDELYMAKLI